jgi:hypothetical protein
MSSEESSPLRLTAEQRSKLVPDIDVEALERFLAYVAKTDDNREAFLRMFMQRPNQSFQIIGAATGGDATIKALLDEIWAPTWIEMGPDAIEHSDSPLPGRELARARLGLPSRPKE